MPAPHLIGRALIAAALAAVGFAPPARAADQPPAADRPAEPRRAPSDRPADDPRPEPGVMLDRMKADLLSMDLTAEQKAQVEEIFAKGREALAAQLRQGEGKEPAKRAEGARAIIQAMREKLGGVLTEEQRQSLRQRLSRARQGIEQGGGMLADRIRSAMSSIELNDEQKQKLDALLAESQAKAREINEQTRGKLRDLMQDTRGKIDALLTPAQREKLNETLPEGAPPRRNPEGGERRREEPPADRL